MHVFTSTVGEGDRAIYVLVAQHSVGQSLEALFETLYTDFAEQRQRAACIVIRPDVRDHFEPTDLEAILSGSIVDSPFLLALRAALDESDFAFARMPNTSISVLFNSGHSLHLSENINPHGFETPFSSRFLEEKAILDTLRDSELVELVGHSKALLPVLPGSYYLAPSNRPARAFLRVGNVQFSRHSIDAVCFWLLPHVRNCDAILADTWSISSIAFDLAGIIGKIRGSPPVPVEMLTQYQDNSSERLTLAAEALDRLSAELEPDFQSSDGKTKANIVCILSATQSGSLAGVINELVNVTDFSIDLSYVALFQLGPDVGIASLTDFSKKPEFSPITELEVGEKAAVEIDPQSYFPLSYNDVELEVRIRHAKAAKEFVEAQPEPGIFSLHRDHRTNGTVRHHAVHVDTTKLVDSKNFRNLFSEQLLKLSPRPSLVITPPHEAAHELGELASAVLSEENPVAHYEHSTLALDSDDPDQPANKAIFKAIAGLNDSESLLVLDDAYITGTRLSAYQNRLRAMNCKARLHYHVAIARPADLDDWQRAKAMLGWRPAEASEKFQRNTVNATYEISLPNWPEKKCPWCIELQAYDDLAANGVKLPELFAKRQMRLVEAKHSGLVDDAFLQDERSTPMRLEGGSIFAPESASQATVFAAVSSALQSMRTISEDDVPKLGPRRFPLSTVLKASKYLVDSFTDSIVRASIIRAAVSEELIYADGKKEQDRQAKITSLLASDVEHIRDLSLELVLAAMSGKGDLSEEATALLKSCDERSEALTVLST